MNLIDQEIVEIASLKESIGYKLVLDRIQCELDGLQQDILDISEPLNTEKVLFWRALYKVLYILKTTPEQMSEEMKRIKTDSDYQFEQNQMQQVPKEYMDIILKEYLKKKNSKNKI